MPRVVILAPMNDEPTPICEECGATYVIEEVYARFRSDFESRVGFAFTGKRPRWIQRFCSEPCRYVAERRRVDGHNAANTEKKAAARKAKREGRSPDHDVE
jgi:hypothetical protein